jgi:hypothetical protein
VYNNEGGLMDERRTASLRATEPSNSMLRGKQMAILNNAFFEQGKVVLKFWAVLVVGYLGIVFFMWRSLDDLRYLIAVIVFAVPTAILTRRFRCPYCQHPIAKRGLSRFSYYGLPGKVCVKCHSEL